MSRVTKRKHVMKEMLTDDYELPKDNQLIVRIVSSRGNNLHEVESPNDNEENYLASMPTKFRKNVWVKRGDYVVVEPIEEGDKVKAEIIRILTAEHIKIYTKEGAWPKKFTKKRPIVEDNDELFENTNRPPNIEESDDSTTDNSDTD